MFDFIKRWFDAAITYIVNRKLERWKVHTYATNTYLFTIPVERIAKKKTELREELVDTLCFWRKMI